MGCSATRWVFQRETEAIAAQCFAAARTPLEWPTTMT